MARAYARVALRTLCVVALAIGAPLAGTLIARPGAAHGGAPAPASASTVEPVPAGDDDFVGVLLPSRMANLTPRSDGKIVEVRRKVGEAVAKDDVIVAFDLRERQEELTVAEAQLKAARADAASAAADLSFARKRAARRSATVDVDGQEVALVSGEEAAQARSQADSARARASAAAAHIAEQQAHVEQLRLAVKESEIRAPFDGVVSAINFEPGTTAHPGDVVARVVGGPGVRVRAAVPEERASVLGARRARVILEGRTFDADIDQVSPEPEPASRAFFVEGNLRIDSAARRDLSELSGRRVRVSLLGSPSANDSASR